MVKKLIGLALLISMTSGVTATPAFADAAKPGQSMTHMKTEKGISATLEAAGVVLYVQGGATAAVMGDSISSAEGQVVFHIPITETKTGVEHTGSNIVLFNTANNSQIVIKNPVIDLKAGIVKAVIPQASAEAITLFTITNAKDLKAKITNDKKSKLRTTAYDGAKLALAPGLAASISSLLGLPVGSLPDGLAFASASVSLYSAIKNR
jgi:hypothetical protein